MTDALAITGLTKAFGGTLALDDVSLTIREGEVHGLLGENGSGKSTLIKILAGYHAPGAGALEVRGHPVELPLQPGQFRSLGIEFVHQDLGLIPSMSVLENLYIGELVRSTDRFQIRWATRRRAARAVFERYGLSLDPSATVDQLEPVQRALLAIVRAIEGIREGPNSIQPGHRLLVLDEPTVFLPRDGIEHLFALMRAIAAAGSSLLFVSHDLDEVLEITDRVTVLRNGRSVGTVVTSEVTDARLVEMIVGRDVVRTEARETDSRDLGSVGLSVKRLSGSITRDVSFTLHEGETLGLTGLEGSGCEEIPYLLFGARASAGGTMTVNGETIETRELTPPRALRLGLGLISGDRKSNGSVESLPAVDNVTLQVVDQYFRRFVLRRGAMRSDARRLMTELDVRPLEPSLLYGSFSGGNQQKLLLGKWLQANPRVLLLHEPTQGVDIGAREQIFRLLQAATGAGAAVLCASTDYEQLVRICTRVLVFGRGRVVRELVGAEVTKDRIADEAYNSVNLSERVLVGGK